MSSIPLLERFLSYSTLYNFSQRIMGAHSGRLDFSKNYIRANKSDFVLDIGCGTGEILDYLPAVNYYGIDFSLEYIEAAKLKFGDKGQFKCMTIKEGLPSELNNKFDVALAIGVLHHLNDDESLSLIEAAYNSLIPGGRLVTIDPCFDLNQTILAKKIISRDRGQFIRTGNQYQALFDKTKLRPIVYIKNRAWIPYTHCIMECEKC